MEMSTRRSASLGTTRILSPEALCLPRTEQTRSAVTRMRMRGLNTLGTRMCVLAPDNDVLFGVIESDALTGLNCGDSHAERDGMTIASVNVGVGLLAVADGLEPVANVGDGHVIGASVSGGGCRGGGLC